MDRSLYAHALRSHRLDADAPLPRDGYPFPDQDAHPRLWVTPRPADPRLEGVDVAAALDRHLAEKSFHGLNVPRYRNDHIAAAALRGDRELVRAAGRRLVRHGTDRCDVTVGLALLAADDAAEDVPLIQTIGLLSDHFGGLAAEALSRRPGAERSLLWLAQRSAGWGRVHVIDAICRLGVGESRDWLLRHACQKGDYLAGHYAYRVATAAHLHEAITRDDADDALVDHTGRLLRAMTELPGMGPALADYPPGAAVMEAWAGHVARRPSHAAGPDGLGSRS
ncbi:hypothetical protein AB0M54_36140 [Actinoplanes sp. NPDC051470]|uniref:hypothetical protein n=1 Tax=Actinoplanes sp. NPDC051470 TaxID=3157224 RepID=UPI00344376D8